MPLIGSARRVPPGMTIFHLLFQTERLIRRVLVKLVAVVFAAPLVAWLGLAGTFAAVGGALVVLGLGLWLAQTVRPAPTAVEA